MELIKRGRLMDITEVMRMEFDVAMRWERSSFPLTWLTQLPDPFSTLTSTKESVLLS